MINMVDEFVIYVDAQYTKRDWRNRNLIKTINGVKWITIPVEVKNKYKQSIKETKVSGNDWINNHVKILNHNYSRAEYFEEVMWWLRNIYSSCEKQIYLSEINLLFIKGIVAYLGIKTKISFSSDYVLEGNNSEKAMNICLQAGAEEYLTGPAAKSYLDLEAFNRNNIKVKWMDYSVYKTYSQLYPPFIHEVSIIDLLFNNGKDSVNYMKSFS